MVVQAASRNRVFSAGILLAALLSFLVVLVVCRSSFPTTWQMTLLSALTLVAIVTASSSPRHSVTCLGVFLCIGALCGGESFSVWVSGLLFGAVVRGQCPVLLGRRDRALPQPPYLSKQLLLLALQLYLAVIAGAGVRAVLSQFDFVLLRSSFELGGLTATMQLASEPWMQNVIHVIRAVLRAVLGLLLFVQLCRWNQEQRLLRPLLWGLSIGIVLATLYTLGQYLSLHPLFSLTRSGFWVYTGRYSSSFSDPNAFGLMIGLLLPITFVFASVQQKSWLRGSLFAVIALFAFAGLWSGSRTYWLFCCWWLAIAAKAYFSRRALVLLVVCAVVSVVLLGHPAVSTVVRSTVSAPSIDRVLETVQWDNRGSLFETRIVFWKIALAVWSASPLIGVGLGGFYGMQEPAAQRLGISLGEWRDNANNFYLQLLAETGMFGLLLCILAFLLIPYTLGRVTKGDGVLERRLHFVVVRALVALSLLFIIGPHLAFAEVWFLVIVQLFFLVACSSRERSSFAKSSMVWSLLLGVVLVYISFGIAEGVMSRTTAAKGFYATEQNADRIVRWTSKRGYVSICGNERSTQSPRSPLPLEVAVPRPDLPVTITISGMHNSRDEVLTVRELQNPEWYTIPLDAAGYDRIRIEVDRVWQPSPQAAQGDTRFLGVQVHWKEEFCE